MISLFTYRYGEVSTLLYNPNKTCLAYTYCTLSAEKITAWCKMFYVEDYGRRKKVAETGFEPPTLGLVDKGLMCFSELQTLFNYLFSFFFFQATATLSRKKFRLV